MKPSDLHVHLLLLKHAQAMVDGRMPMPFGNEAYWQMFIDETMYLIARRPALLTFADKAFTILNEKKG